jgi:ADP-heptose:LPS heptosyltransferase
MSGPRVLAVRSRALGDIVTVTPALRAFKRTWPGCTVEVVVEARYAEALADHPYVDHVWPLVRSSLATLRLARTLRARRYDIAVDFFGNPRSAHLVWLSGAPLRVGFALRGRGRAYTHQVPRHVPPPWGDSEYAALPHLRLAAAAGAPHDDWRPEICVTAAARAQAEAWWRGWGFARRVVGLVAAGGWPTKTWPVGYAALLARGLQARGVDVLLVTGPGEDALTGRLAGLVPGLRVLPPCGIQDLAAVVERLDLLAGTDAGPKHLAVALGTPSFTWFGPTRADAWSPPDPRHACWRSPLPCAGCDLTRCQHWSCLPALRPEEASERVLEHLKSHGRTAARLDPAAHA